MADAGVAARGLADGLMHGLRTAALRGGLLAPEGPVRLSVEVEVLNRWPTRLLAPHAGPVVEAAEGGDAAVRRGLMRTLNRMDAAALAPHQPALCAWAERETDLKVQLEMVRLPEQITANCQAGWLAELRSSSAYVPQALSSPLVSTDSSIGVA